ncbi:hypothetical protein QJQ45_018465 [Haematococcus lacustris]|nr:hypothetical protein QJQ45_018465 [Haematococcus lacustris]
MMRRTVCFAALVLLAAWGIEAASVLEGLEDDVPVAKTETFMERHSEASVKVEEAPAKKPPKSFEQLQQEQKQAKAAQQPFGLIEAGAAVLMVLFFINVLWGRRVNQSLADSWASTFAQPGGLFDKNFSLLGTGDSGSVLMKEAGNCYKFYASGRRHVQGLLATLQLKARQDLLSRFWNLVNPGEDLVTFEAFMTEAAMPPMVLAVGTPRAIRALKNDQVDVATYTKRITPPKDLFPSWPLDRLHIMAEHSTLFTELFGEPKLQQALSPEGPHAKVLKYLRCIHITSEASTGSHKRVLTLTLALPPAHAMADLTPLVALLPLLIDLVGTYKLSPDLKRKAEVARSKVAEEMKDQEELKRKRLEALALRKAEKLQAERAKLARLPPEERQRAEEKMERKMKEKMMKKRTVIK